MRILTAEQVARYHEDGFVCPVPALSPSEVRDCRARLEAFEASQGRPLGRIPGQLRAKTHLLFPWLAALVRHPAVLAPVEDLIGPDLLVYHLTMWIKEPGDDAFVSWHQDGTYFGLEPADQHVTAWVALTDSTPETGCVTALPGSHRRGQLPHTSQRSAANLLSNGQRAATDVDEARAAPLAMRAGELSLHHTHLLHSSAPNRGHDRRIGVGISYIPTHVRHAGPLRLTASLVRGMDRHGHFDPEPVPRADFDAEARAAHAGACARFFASHGSVRTEAVET
ncbi:MAG TPA: phytanoyl-CoA dioxygenase family protein [Candidatus Limnocylindrales bacterium]|nr:phytanoyl-CoA dioxygenase family protein [Candidatus Limnocylindrales bacterium]